MEKTRKQINQMYRDWRRANGNKKPNRVIVKIIWQDDYDNGDDTPTIGTIGLKPDAFWGKSQFDNPAILWYAGTLDSLWELRKLDNGSDFIVVDVVEFYKSKK